MASLCNASGEYYSRTTSLPDMYNCTLMCWWYLEAAAGVQAAFQFGNIAGDLDWELGVHGAGFLVLYLWRASGGTSVDGSTLTTGTWYHMALTSTTAGTNSTKAYLNGVLDAQLTPSAGQANSELQFPGNVTASTNSRIASVKIWDSVLTATEIQQEMRQYLPVRTANLHGFWPLLSTGDDEIDFSGAAKTMTVNGTPTTVDGPPIPWKLGRRRVVRTPDAPASTLLPFRTRLSAQRVA
jgi:Concanavalin A-like lectin/glucanases superfamily